MNKKPLVFRVRRFFGLTDPELHWIRTFLPSAPHTVLAILQARVSGILTESTYKVCAEFLDGVALPCESPSCERPERQQEVTDALLTWLEH